MTPEADNRVRVLEAITDSALGRLELSALLRAMLERVRDLFEVDTATVLLYDEAAQQLAASASVSLEEEVLQGVRIPMGAGFAGRVAASRRPVVLHRVDESTVVNPLLWERGLRSLLGVPMLARDELIGVLHVGSASPREFDEGEVRLLRLVADRLALATQAEVAGADRVAAEALQRGLLPGTLPTIRGLEFSARYVPGTRTAVGGDWYDVFPLPGERVGIAIGDVAGHGLPAAVVMGRMRSALRAYALDCDDPAEVLGRLDRKVDHFEHGAMATVAYGVVDRSQERLVLSLAGHPPPVRVTPGHPAALVTVPADPPVGMGVGTRGRRSTSVEVPVGSVLAFYTDGLVERRDQIIDEGLGKLVGAVTADTAERVCVQVMATMVGADPTHDDVALLVARRHSA